MFPFSTRWSWVCRSGKCTPAELAPCETGFPDWAALIRFLPCGFHRFCASATDSLAALRGSWPLPEKTISCQPTPLTLRSRHPVTVLVFPSESTHRYHRYLSQAWQSHGQALSAATGIHLSDKRVDTRFRALMLSRLPCGTHPRMPATLAECTVGFCGEPLKPSVHHVPYPSNKSAVFDAALLKSDKL